MQGKVHKKHRFAQSIPLEQFASAKRSSYDPRIAKEQQRIEKLKRIHKLNKLKKRLGDELQPKLVIHNDEDEVGPTACNPCAYVGMAHQNPL
jgi:hypothetical protein